MTLPEFEPTTFTLSVPEDHEAFQFPFTPYTIQLEFMRQLYAAMERRQVGIFESPTGTGKSLSLICGALRWLKDNEMREEQAYLSNIEHDAKQSSDVLEWELAFDIEKRKQEYKELILNRQKEMAERLKRVREREERERRSKIAHRQKKQKGISDCEVENDDELVVEEYHSDEEKSIKADQGTALNDDVYSPQVRELLKRFQEGKSLDSLEGIKEEEQDEEPDVLKIYYTSRTHSQLTQFIHELYKTGYVNEDGVRTVSLGSRKALCINEKVRKLASVALMNDRCLEMQKKGTAAEHRCPYLHTQDKSKMLDYRDHVLARVRDIEELVDLGRRLDTCPYYGTRKSIRQCQIVTLPYNLLLQKSARESLGISLSNHIVIIDEAHNLIDTICSVHSVQLDRRDITLARKQLECYLERYQRRLKGSNVVYIRQILILLRALENHRVKGEDRENKQKEEGAMREANGFVHELGIDHMNLYKIERYLRESKVAWKLSGFMEKIKKENNGEIQDLEFTSIPALNRVQSFLMALTHANQDGRVQVSSDSYKYLLLNPANEFRPIIEEARSVILAGGTMEPMSDFINFLFPFLPQERVARFTCGHIVPREQLLVVRAEEGPTGYELDFSFERRGNAKLMDELGLILVNLCAWIPDGVVVFFPSYSYLSLVLARWSETGVRARLEKRKKLFTEQRDSSDTLLRDYSLAIEQTGAGTGQTGAMLLCVVGGKMSEGINFSDRLGRGVIMVGLPFSNLKSPELQEKMRFADAMRSGSAEGGGGGGSEYYENLCMRALNQSIGRAIRHKNDFAAIVLLDRRFQQARLQRKLPHWIGHHLEVCARFREMGPKVTSFFRRLR
ncbi:uncharacterized protein VTP21DRAFT_2209 [Calcarisporiella thermophila]|uniref:uncharacterized protein n=1 Tax=Calcarisporiella thermophila TaxID=911321 RepID=UPI003741F99F